MVDCDGAVFLHRFAKGILGSMAVEGGVVVLVADASCSGDAEITGVGGSGALVLGADDTVVMLVRACVLHA